MHLWQDIVYAELVDSETEKRAPYNGEGVTVYTHLERTSPTHDTVLGRRYFHVDP